MAQATPGFRLSRQQEQAWIAQQGSISALNVCCAFAVSKVGFEGSVIRACLDKVVAEHEILRTVFERRQGIKLPFQVILPSVAPVWQEQDFSALNSDARETQLVELLDSEFRRVFDLEHGPVLAAHWVKTADNQGVLVLCGPAVILDFESLKILARQLFDHLGSNSAEHEILQYADVSEWQSELQRSEDEHAEHARQHWQSVVTKPFSLPLEKSAHDPFASSTIEIGIETALIEEIAARFSQSIEDVLFAGWQTAVFRWTAQPFPVLSRSFSGRTYEEVTQSIGPYAKSLPVEGRFDADYTFEEIVSRAAQSREEALAAEDYYPSLGDSRDEVRFQFLDLDGASRVGAVEFRVADSRVLQDAFRVRLTCLKQADGLKLQLDYDNTRFSRFAAESMAKSFSALIRSACRNPEIPVARLNCLSEERASVILNDWNRTEKKFPREARFEKLFELQARLTPDRPAVACSGRQLTYRSLDLDSNRLARHLRGAGVTTNSLVGLFLDPSIEVMTCVLAIMKAGGAYVALNPESPTVRLQHHLRSVGCLIAGKRLLPQIPADFAGRVIVVEDENWKSQDSTTLSTIATSEDLAYVIYTSGSTGIPKGVGVRHRNLVNYSTFICDRLALKPREALNFATVSTLAADLGNTCIFPALISGGCVHIVPYEIATDAERFAKYNDCMPSTF